MGFNRTNPTLFYSRRIGRAPQGAAAGEYVDRPSATTILGAAKLTGKTSRGWTVNFIDAVTAREFADTATGGERGRDRGGAAHQLPRGARAPRRRPARRIRHAHHARQPRPERSGAGGAAAGSALRRRRRRPPVPHGQARLRRHRQLLGQPRRRVAGTRSTRLQRSSARYYPAARRHASRPSTRRPRSLSGWSLQSDFNKNSGNIRPNASFWAVSPGFEVNDAGFVDQRRPDGRARGGSCSLKPTPDRFSRSRQLVRREVEHVELRRRPDGRRLLRELLRDAPATTGRSSATAHAAAWVYSDRLTRGGPMMRSPGFTDVVGRDRGRRAQAGRLVRRGRPTSRGPTASWSGSGGSR